MPFKKHTPEEIIGKLHEGDIGWRHQFGRATPPWPSRASCRHHNSIGVLGGRHWRICATRAGKFLKAAISLERCPR